MKFTYDHYYTYEELSSALKELAHACPDLVSVESIGKSGQGKDLLVATITNKHTGEDRSKPGFYIDGNHHAGEVTGSMVALYTADYLASNYGTNPDVTKLLDTTTFYIHPRVSPDGAELFLTTPDTMRSVPRLYPFPEWEEMPGLYPCDVDGDGEILLMRVEDPDGEWKVSSLDKRAMARRSPDEDGGVYYRVYQEGLIKEYDGATFKPSPLKWGIDLNRNYPAAWELEHRQSGAGPYPLSEPETRAVAGFVLAHPNIVIGITHHTTGGVILHPPGTKPQTQIPQDDLRALKEIGKLGTEVTGYPTIPIFEDFMTDKANYSAGAFDDWLYQHRGVISYTVELWNMAVRAGVSMWPRREKSYEEQESDFAKMLKWADMELGEGAFKPWTPFQHPQLGKVEIGGWRFKFVVQNAPPQFLAGECHKNTVFCIRAAKTLPHLKVAKVKTAEVEDGVYEVTCVVRNSGYLPTYGTRISLDQKLHLTGWVELRGEGLEVVGEAKKPLGNLSGRANSKGEFWMGYFRGSDEDKEAVFRWVVRAKGEAKGKIVASATRAGTATAEFTIGTCAGSAS